MPATLLDSGTFNLNDGSGGHVIDLGSAPNADDVDVLCVNSNTVVTTPSGFTAQETLVNSQGSYIYSRKAAGGEGQTVTITTSGNHETAVGWSRWSGLDAVDDTASTGVDGVAGTSTPAHSTGTLAAADELIIAFGALHSFGAVPSAPVWAGGYTALTDVVQGSGSSGVANYVGYDQPVGTAAESPSVSWTGNVSDRYMLTVTFTTTSGNPPVELGQAVETDTATALGRSKARAVGQAAETSVANALSRSKRLAVGQVLETDTAQPLTTLSVVTLGQAVETGTATALGRTKKRALGQAAEVDTAGTVAPPGSGIVPRPNTGTVTRPFTGIVTRP